MYEDLKRRVESQKPTIYADVNVFRYLAYNELEIIDPDRFLWVYSGVHLDELARGTNQDALEGMSQLNAVEIEDVLHNFKSIGNVKIREFFEPELRYERHLEAIAGYEDAGDMMVELLIRGFGANNYEQLALTPNQLITEIDNMLDGIGGPKITELRERTKEVSDELDATIKENLGEQMPIDETRKAVGLTSSEREKLKDVDSSIEKIWDLIEPAMAGQELDVFFGFKPNPITPEMPHNQHTAYGSAHTVLNFIGYNPDKGLANRDKIKNILSDGQHIGMASYCSEFVTSDIRLCNKANAMFEHTGTSTIARHYVYNANGCVLDIPSP